MLVISISLTGIGFVAIAILEAVPRDRLNPPFYLHKAAFTLLIVGMILLSLTVVMLALSVRRY